MGLKAKWTVSAHFFPPIETLRFQQVNRSVAGTWAASSESLSFFNYSLKNREG